MKQYLCRKRKKKKKLSEKLYSDWRQNTEMLLLAYLILVHVFLSITLSTH